MEHCTLIVRFGSVLLAQRSKMRSHAMGMMPFASPYPIMEYDLPDPVCPYAKRLQW